MNGTWEIYELPELKHSCKKGRNGLWWVLYGSRKGMQMTLRDPSGNTLRNWLCALSGSTRNVSSSLCYSVPESLRSLHPEKGGMSAFYLSSRWGRAQNSAKMRSSEGWKNRVQTLGYKPKGYINKGFLVFFMIPSFASIRHSKSITPDRIFTNTFHSKLY